MILKKRRQRKEHILARMNGSVFSKTVFTVLCLIGFIGSSFGPILPRGISLGSLDPRVRILLTESEEPKEEDPGLFYSVYRVGKGDTISGIADTFDVSLDTIVSFNAIQSAKSLQPDQMLKIPNMTGILYQTRKGETVAAIASRYEIAVNRIIETNHLMSESFDATKTIFLPDARLPRSQLKEISGDMFRWPVRGRITSWFGWRSDPFSGRKTYHNALDIAAPIGTTIFAANEGVVSDSGYSPIMGKFVAIKHSGGWSTFYGHMSVIAVTPGQSVRSGTRIGNVGNTGYTTGPHVHFSIFKNGRAVNPSSLLN